MSAPVPSDVALTLFRKHGPVRSTMLQKERGEKVDGLREQTGDSKNEGRWRKGPVSGTIGLTTLK